MDEFKDKLLQMKEEQSKLSRDYEALIKEYESNDLIQENQTLRKQHENYKKRLSSLKQKQKETEDENVKLKYALKEQILDEKLNILKISREKINTYFSSVTQSHLNKLYTLEFEAHEAESDRDENRFELD